MMYYVCTDTLPNPGATMGASSWRYYTSYKTDPEEALQQLRRDVFARGEYSMGFGGFSQVNEAANTGMPGASATSGATNPFLRAAQMAGVWLVSISGSFKPS